MELVHHILRDRNMGFDALPTVIYWAVVGLLLGYPRCCIEDFIGRVTGKRPLEHDPRLFNGSGFVPCAKCSVTFADAPDDLETLINSQRHELLPRFRNGASIRQVKVVYEKEFKAPRS